MKKLTVPFPEFRSGDPTDMFMSWHASEDFVNFPEVKELLCKLEEAVVTADMSQEDTIRLLCREVAYRNFLVETLDQAVRSNMARPLTAEDISRLMDAEQNAPGSGGLQ